MKDLLWLVLFAAVVGFSIMDYRLVETFKDGKTTYSIEEVNKKENKKPEAKKFE